MANEYKMTTADWQGPNGTSWVINNAATAKPHYPASRSRWAQMPQPLQGQPLPVVESPLQTDRVDSFVAGVVAAEAPHARPSAAARLIGGALGAAIGVAAYRRFGRSR